MNFIQRALVYISRRKGKAVNLFILVFIVAVFLISCFGVLKASKRLSKDIRTSLGAAVYIRANTEVKMNENGETEVKENDVHITEDEIGEIMHIGEINYCNPINYGFVKSDALEFVRGDKHTDENNMGKVTGLRFSALASDFIDETAILLEGTHITETDRGKILISEQLANANHLSVGDKVILTHARLGEVDGEYIDEIPVKTAYTQVEISGIYELKIEDAAIKPTASVADNRIYASLDVLNELKESEACIYTCEVDFYITDPDQLESVIRNVQLLQSIDWSTHFIRTNDFQYSRIVNQLSSLVNLVKILLVLVSVVSTALLILLLIMRMRSRMQEAGILLSVGVTKTNVIAGFMCEILSVAIFALILSYIVSFGVTGFLDNILFGKFQPNLLNKETITVGIQNSLKSDNRLKLSVTEILLIYFWQIIVIVTSTFVSSITIMRLKPKEILSKMS